QKGEPELPDITQPLERRRVHQPHREIVERDVVPERIADDLERHRGSRLQVRGLREALQPQTSNLEPKTCNSAPDSRSRTGLAHRVAHQLLELREVLAEHCGEL